TAGGGAARQEPESLPSVPQGAFESGSQQCCPLVCAKHATAGATVPKRTNPITSRAVSRRSTIPDSDRYRATRFSYFRAPSQLGCAPGHIVPDSPPENVRRRATLKELR